MLKSVFVKNLALIEEIEIEFEDGMNVLTGETGAGKSIILGSIHLALGGKYSRDILRDGAEYGFVELTFYVEDEKHIEKLKELDIYPEDQTLVLSRRLMEKRSICKINGETVTLNLMRAAAAVLIDIYGQHEYETLTSKKNHLDFVDAFGKNSLQEIKAEVKSDYQTYAKLTAELAQMNMDEAARMKELDFLNFEVKEIQEADLKVGEDENLEEQYRMMTHHKTICENLFECQDLISNGSMAASEMISRALRCNIDAARYDTDVENLSSQLQEIENLLNDYARDLEEYLSSHDFSEQDFADVENRLNDINRLKTKYGASIEEIFAYEKEKEAEIEKLEDYEQRKLELEKEVKIAKDTLSKACAKLTKLRKEVGKIFAEEITEGLKELNFADVHFEIAHKELENFTGNGKDALEFMISLNPGQPIRPLTEVASGGELSRIMLAIKTVMASQDEIDTLIFDEIDVGISGRTAQKVAEKMAVIAKNHQVICITHLAQIASMADVHYRIEKKVEKGSTHTTIYELPEDEMVNEIARILGGAEITEAVMSNAKEMKALAREKKAKL